MTICKNAKVNYWAADMELSSMQAMPYINSDDESDNGDEDDEETNGKATNRSDDDDDEFIDDALEREQKRLERKQKRIDERLAKNPTKDDMVVFKRISK